MTSVSPEPITTEPKPGSATGSRHENGSKSDLPIGLAELHATDKIVVQQMTGLLQASCCGYEGENMFEISDRFNHLILRAHEDSNCCSRQCCERLRSFTMTIRDRQGDDVIRITRPQRCDNCLCCPCYNQVMEVECPVGNVVGSVKQNLSLFRPTFEIIDATDKVRFTIEGPSACKSMFKTCCAKCCCQSCCLSPNVVFHVVHSESGDKVGDITKLKKGPMEKQNDEGNFDRFGIDFPDDADIGIKVVLVATCFMIDYLYFEGHDDEDDIM